MADPSISAPRIPVAITRPKGMLLEAPGMCVSPEEPAGLIGVDTATSRSLFGVLEDVGFLMRRQRWPVHATIGVKDATVSVERNRAATEPVYVSAS